MIKNLPIFSVLMDTRKVGELAPTLFPINQLIASPSNKLGRPRKHALRFCDLSIKFCEISLSAQAAVIPKWSKLHSHIKLDIISKMRYNYPHVMESGHHPKMRKRVLEVA